ncbi:unnamed protein product [Didymodactylos carnosus]|uniref:Uncharacterized protein n=2 Tax=Didymodactylos carnosus TaxID=1234261 RepID=A0A815IL71_9BILA|nr:unnamed protein product [Didymodactylos carnosus]CAF4254881.1 unnamed protein product [Didymodactylos carnosus]
MVGIRCLPVISDVRIRLNPSKLASSKLIGSEHWNRPDSLLFRDRKHPDLCNASCVNYNMKGYKLQENIFRSQNEKCRKIQFFVIDIELQEALAIAVGKQRRKTEKENERQKRQRRFIYKLSPGVRSPSAAPKPTTQKERAQSLTTFSFETTTTMTRTRIINSLSAKSFDRNHPEDNTVIYWDEIEDHTLLNSENSVGMNPDDFEL